MTQHITNQELLKIVQDIDQWMNRSPAWAIFMGHKVKRFHEQNRFRIQTLHSTLDAMLNKYVEKDKTGHPIMVAYQNGHKFKFKTDEDENKYNEEFKFLMNQSFDVVL